MKPPRGSALLPWTETAVEARIFQPTMFAPQLRAFRAPALSSFCVALATLAGACSDGGAERADGPPRFGDTSNTPYVPSNQTPTDTNTNTDPYAPGGGGTTTTGDQDPPQNDPAEDQDDELPLDPDTGTTAGLGAASMGGSGSSQERYFKTDVTRDGQNYFFMANGWGPNFTSQSITYNGTSFTVNTLQGAQGPNYEPASYPTVFCGEYSDSRSRACGLPAALDSMTSLRTGWSWNANGNNGQYNAAYDIWLGTSNERSSFSGYLMVWYREPAGQQPAGRLTTQDITVQNVPGNWDIWEGQVGGRPIINYVRNEGQDTPSMEFDILDFVRDVQTRGKTLAGTHVLSVAVGFEIWNGPITNLQSTDFYVDVQ